MHGKPSRVLVVEDDISMANLLAQLVETLWPGPEVTTVTVVQSLEAAVAYLTDAYPDRSPDLVVADLQLPDSTGVATVDTLMTHLTLYIPVVVISGTVTPLEGLLTLRHGATSFVSKDEHCTPSYLFQVLSNAWARAQGVAFRRTRAKPEWPDPQGTLASGWRLLALWMALRTGGPTRALYSESVNLPAHREAEAAQGRRPRYSGRFL